MKQVLGAIRKQGIIGYLKNNLLYNRSTKQTIAKNSFWLIFADLFAKGFGFILLILIARAVGVEQYGVYGFATAFTAMFILLADFGLSTIVIRNISRKSNDTTKYLQHITTLKLILGVFAFLLLAIASQFVNKGTEVKYALYLMALVALLVNINEYFRSFFRATEHMEYEAVSKAIGAIVTLLLVGAALLMHKGLIGILSAYVVASVIAVLATLILIRRKLVKFNLRYNPVFMKKILWEAWPLLAGTICTTIYIQSDTVLLSFFRTFTEVGLYQAAYKILFGFQIVGLIHVALYPKLSQLYAAKDYAKYRSTVHRVMRISALVLIPIGIFITICSRQIMTLLFGPAFSEAGPILTILIWNGILIHFASFWGNALIISNNQKKWFYVTLVGAAVNLSLNLLFIPKYGMLAAAITTLISEMAVFATAFLMVPKDIRI